ncbi:MAG: hypothetical protein LPK02_01280, partial [Rhodobacterales bacterium]|nr:hypothetical protein [Rhodobacterales bacterium]
MTHLDDAIAAFAAAAPQDRAGKQALWDRWAALIKDAPAVLPGLYRTYLDAVRGLLEDAPPAALGGREGAFQFVMVFSASNYLSDFQQKKIAWRLLQDHHAEHLDLLHAALARPDHVVCDTRGRFETGRWGALVAAMLRLYRVHCVLGPGWDVHEGDIIPLMPAFFRAFPLEKDRLLIGMLADHPDAASVAAGWVRYHLEAGGDLSEGPMVALASDLMGAHAQAFGALFAQGPAILAEALADAATWPEARRAAFWRCFVEEPLNIVPTTREEALAAARRVADVYKRARAASEGDMSHAAKARRESDTRNARTFVAEAAQIEADFDDWTARRGQGAVRGLSAAATKRDVLSGIARHLPAPHGALAQALLDEAKADAARPKV